MGTGLALSRYLCANAVAIRYFAPGTCACTYVRVHLRAPAPTCGIKFLLTLDLINTHTGLVVVVVVAVVAVVVVLVVRSTSSIRRTRSNPVCALNKSSVNKMFIPHVGAGARRCRRT